MIVVVQGSDEQKAGCRSLNARVAESGTEGVQQKGLRLQIRHSGSQWFVFFAEFCVHRVSCGSPEG